MSGHWIAIGGEDVLLHPERALFWPRGGLLVVADTHFGKEHVFRRSGLAIPDGGLERDLRRLEALIDTLEPRRLLVVGDLVHAPPQPGAAWAGRLAEWAMHPDRVPIDVVAGNHDRGLHGLGDWPVSWHVTALEVGPFRFEHVPGATDGARGAIQVAGHWHPSVDLRADGERLRLPVFVVGTRSIVLPAFGSFTGGQPVSSETGRLYAVTPDAVLPLPVGGSHRG